MLAVLAVSAVIAVPAVAKTTDSFQDNVTITNGGCKVAVHSVSRANTRIIFHVVNNGGGGKRFGIAGKSTPTLKAHDETDLIVNFPGAGTWTYACTAGSKKHTGKFTIRAG